MTFVVTEQCIRCKFMDCIEPCPVNCFHEGPDFLVIDPEECIDCNACTTECPVDAIHQDTDLPAEQQQFIEINRRLSQIWPRALVLSAPLPDRERWRGVPMKRQFLQDDAPAESASSDKGVRT